MAAKKQNTKEWLSLPKNEQELQQIWLKKKKPHPALQMAYGAIQMNRSPKQAFILLLGLSGAGKSSTTNYLFGQDIAPSSDQRSETRSATEYVVTMKSNAWMVPDMGLSIIDTPGFCDTDGLEQDARNMICISNFLKQHPFLRGRFPNLVFLIINIQDNRIEGPNSHFSKMLRAVTQIKAVDQNNPNVVVVLTHAASVARSAKKWKEKVDKKITEVKALVETYLGITPEVVVQENLPEDFDLEEDKDGDYHLLPDGTKQPKHLYKACEILLNTSKDELGHEAIAVCFRRGNTKDIKKGTEVSSFTVDQADVTKMHATLLQTVVALSDTEVCRMLDVYNQERNIATLNNDIIILKVRFRDLNITEARDLQSSTMNKVKARLLPIHLTSRMEKILQEVFGLQYEQVSGHVCHIGKGYNVFSDSPTQTDPLVIGDASMGKLGLPESLIVNECCNYDVKCISYEDSSEYVHERLNELNISVEGDINIGAFSMKSRAGCNIKKTSSSTSAISASQTSFSIEQKMFKLSVKQPYTLNEDFKKDINDLPKEYNLKDQNSVEKWKSFFEKWGHYTIVSAYLGGSLTGQMRTEGGTTTDKDTEEMEVEVGMKLSYLNNQGSLDLTKKDSDSTQNKTNRKISSVSLQWKGGDRSYFKNSLDQVGIEDWKNWQQSLEYNPEPLWTSLDLCPIHQIADKVDKDKALEMKKAHNLALGGKFKYEEPVEDTRQTSAPSNTPKRKCFPEDATVLLPDGSKKQMKDVLINDKVLTLDRDGRVVEDRIIAWIHKIQKGRFEFLKMTYNNGNIVISKEHIMYVGDAKTPTLASNVQPGDIIHIPRVVNGRMVSDKVPVHSIQGVNRNGLYTPLTSSGSLFVDGVAVSCYCTLEGISIFGWQIASSHDLAHFGFLPLRLANRLGIDFGSKRLDTETGLHLYAKWLMENVLGCLEWISSTV